jgi:hypothetical protein
VWLAGERHEPNVCAETWEYIPQRSSFVLGFGWVEEREFWELWYNIYCHRDTLYLVLSSICDVMRN